MEGYLEEEPDESYCCGLPSEELLSGEEAGEVEMRSEAETALCVASEY
jgi:hypothetical protein